MSMRTNEFLKMRDIDFLIAGIGIGCGVRGWLMTVEKNCLRHWSRLQQDDKEHHSLGIA